MNAVDTLQPISLALLAISVLTLVVVHMRLTKETREYTNRIWNERAEEHFGRRIAVRSMEDVTEQANRAAEGLRRNYDIALALDAKHHLDSLTQLMGQWVCAIGNAESDDRVTTEIVITGPLEAVSITAGDEERDWGGALKRLEPRVAVQVGGMTLTSLRELTPTEQQDGPIQVDHVAPKDGTP